MLSELYKKLRADCLCVTGHRIEGTQEVPLVLDDKVESLKKTKEATQMLKKLKAWTDIEKVSTYKLM